jgi:hypothetical protein
LHGGTSDAPASVKWPLKNVVDGTSSTLVKGVTVGYVACGEL